MSYQEYRPAPFNILPLVVKNLLIINGILWLADYVFSQNLGLDVNGYLGLYYPTADQFAPYQYVSHLFLHGNFMHLFSNMFALWMFGSVLENHWGPKRFLTFYFVTGLGAAFIHTGWNWFDFQNTEAIFDAYLQSPGLYEFSSLIHNHSFPLSKGFELEMDAFISQWELAKNDPALLSQSLEIAQSLKSEIIQFKESIPTVGASGAVFGVLLAFGMTFPNSLIYVFFAIPIKAKYFVIIYGLFELYSGISNNPNDNVAHFAHLGGMLFGFLLIKHWRNRDRSRFY
ncbi:MAG: rhomboid family intramembrane serine protease [Bacteroidota bacterium]|jgi:membrane associated rhomboid family serine protease